MTLVFISGFFFNIFINWDRPKTAASGRTACSCPSYISPQTWPLLVVGPCVWEQGLWRHPCWQQFYPRGYPRSTLWAWGDCNYKLSRKTWSLTSWRHSSCPWGLSLCGDSDQFQPPERGCRVGLRRRHQCSSRWPLCVRSSDRPGPAPHSRVSWTCPFRQLPLGTTAERKKGCFSF